MGSACVTDAATKGGTARRSAVDERECVHVAHRNQRDVERCAITAVLPNSRPTAANERGAEAYSPMSHSRARRADPAAFRSVVTTPYGAAATQEGRDEAAASPHLVAQRHEPPHGLQVLSAVVILDSADCPMLESGSSHATVDRTPPGAALLAKRHESPASLVAPDAAAIVGSPDSSLLAPGSVHPASHNRMSLNRSPAVVGSNPVACSA